MAAAKHHFFNKTTAHCASVIRHIIKYPELLGYSLAFTSCFPYIPALLIQHLSCLVLV